MSLTRQTTLDEDAPLILDATCSFRKNWPKSATIRIDIRPETKPDIVMDATDLKFPNASFDAIYCDPPHFVIKKPSARIKQWRRMHGRISIDPFTAYGYWKTEAEWFAFIEGTNREFARCLKSNGILYYKITEGGGCTKPNDLIERMTNFVTVKDEVKASKTNFGKAKTHWLTMKPKPKSNGR